MRQYTAAVLLALSLTAPAEAQDGRRGLITSSSCPYTCEDAKVPAESCRERQRGGVCEVEDLRQAPGHRTVYRFAGKQDALPAKATPAAARQDGRRGLITSGNCPFDCGMAKIPEADCRAWQEGDRCQVEDLRQAPGHRTLYRIKR